MVKSFVISVRSSPGFNRANAMTAQVALPKTKYTRTILGPNSVPGFVHSARRVNALSLELTDKFKNRHVDTRDIELSSDLKTLTMTLHTSGRGEPNILVFERQ